MNKKELITEVSEKTGTTKVAVGKILDALLEAVQETVAKGDRVVLVGFGTFEPRQRQERIGRNPSSGEPITIPGCTVPGWSPGKQFKEKVAGG